MPLVVLLAMPFITSALCLGLPQRPWVERVHLVGALATLLAGMNVVGLVIASGPLTYVDNGLYVDALGALLIAVIVGVGGLAALYSVGYLRHEDEAGLHGPSHVSWYYAGFHIFIGTMLLTGMVNNLGLLWVAVEATTIVSAPLVGFTRTKAALEAAWKYLMICSVGITFAFFGVLLTYYAALHALGPDTNLNWTTLMDHAGQLDPGVMKLSFVFIMIGFGTKAGFAPLHTWLPDAHSQAPSPISALLSGVLLNCALLAVLRFHLVTAGAIGPAFSSGLLLTFGLISVALAIPFLLVQRDIKRLLAYSSIEHIGLIGIAIGLGGPLGLYAGLLHLVNHAVTKAMLFFVAGDLVQRFGTRRITAMHGVIQAAPLSGPLLLVGAFAITGLPPSGMFVTELGIVMAGFSRGFGLITVVLVFMLALVFAGMFGHMAGIAFGRPLKTLIPKKADSLGALALALPALAILTLGIYVPPPVSAAIQQAAILLAGGER